MDGAVIAGYPAYDSYRDSGVEWLGDVPAGWAVKKMKYLFRDHSQKGRPDAELLSVTQNQGVVPRSWVENRMVMPSGSLETFKFIERGDFAISLRSFEGGLEYCHHDGIISPAYTVLKSWHNDLEPGYYRYLFKSGAFISELQTSVVGIREGKNISFEELSHSRMPIPPLPEQRAIAGFLDEKCARLDEAVRIKQAQIALLRERRQILIQQAVTRGLNPAAPMKDSGIDWIGQIPAHWEVRRVKYLGIVSPTRTLDRRVPSDEEVVFLPMEMVGEDGSIAQSERRRSREVFSGFTYFQKGDVVIAKITPCFENGKGAWLSELETSHGFGTTELHVIRPTVVMGGFLYSVLNSKAFLSIGEKFMVGSAGQKRVSTAFLANFPMAVPSMDEQAQIVSHIAEVSAKIDDAIAIKESQIAALKEYRTSLINAAVTGKVKVA